MMQFYANHYLSTPTGKSLVNQLTANLPELQQHIYDTHINPHSKIMKETFPDHPLTVGLDSADTGILPLSGNTPVLKKA